MIETRPPEGCEFDLVSLGEVMLRLDPGEGRVRTARRFEAWEGGGEYNVARSMRKVFGLRAGVVTALADNEIGRLVEHLMMQGGVDTSLIRWERYDGVGRTVRNGINFVERGFGVRGGLGVSDRGHTAVSQLAPGMVDWGDLFGRRGVRWLHTGGIFAGLSESTVAVAEEAMSAAQAHGTVVSYDVNYRPSIWEAGGGLDRFNEVTDRLARHADVLIGLDRLEATVDTTAAVMPWLSVVATTLRTVHTASDNDWQAVGWSAETGALSSVRRDHLAILDRIGGGDGFASGLIYGLLQGEGLQQSLELGAAHGALVMTTPGDTSMASLDEVHALACGGSARVRR
jgi:2-dehydro-3-deoxygluconokinase